MKRRVNMYFDDDVMARLKIAAKKDRRSMASFVNAILDDTLPKNDNSPGSAGVQPGAKGRPK